MFHFVDPRTPDPGENTTDGFVIRGDHPGYLEVLLQMDPPEVWSTVYAIKVDEGVGAAVTCWEDRFTSVFEQFSDPTHGQLWENELLKHWPTFGLLLDNTTNGRFGDGAIAEFVDPDDMNTKWFLAMLFPLTEETQYSALDEFVPKIAQLSVQLALEMETPMSWRQKARVTAKGAVAGARAGQARAAPWEARLSWLRTMVGQ